MKHTCQNCAFATENVWDKTKMLCGEIHEKASMIHPRSGVYVEQYLQWYVEPIFEVDKDFGCNQFKQKQS